MRMINCTKALFWLSAILAFDSAAVNAGLETIGSTSSTTARRSGQKVTISQAGAINSISVYHSGSGGQLVVAVYSDASSNPGNLLGRSSIVGVSSTGWQTVSLQSPVTIAANTVIWLAWFFQNSPGTYYNTISESNYCYNSSSWGTADPAVLMPEPFGTQTKSTRQYSVYATYTVSGGGGGTNWTTDANGMTTSSNVGINMPSSSTRKLAVCGLFSVNNSSSYNYSPMLSVRNVGQGGNIMSLHAPGATTESIYLQAGNYQNGYQCGMVMRNAAGSIRTRFSGDGNLSYILDGMSIGSATNVINGVGYSLAVNGAICAKELVITNVGWADHVFKPDYQLLTLKDVEKHIAENGTLPGIPSSEDVGKRGINIGEINAKLLEKIEELTLYLIELKKENEKMAVRLSAVEGKN